MPITPYSKVAFRCKACGRLHTSDDAAEAAHPYCCRVCSAGVTFSPAGVKTISSENWEVLADAFAERLCEMGLSHEDICRHQPWEKGSGKAVGMVNVSAADAPGTKDSN